jgi:hypothetical protein
MILFQNEFDRDCKILVAWSQLGGDMNDHNILTRPVKIFWNDVNTTLPDALPHFLLVFRLLISTIGSPKLSRNLRTIDRHTAIAKDARQNKKAFTQRLLSHIPLFDSRAMMRIDDATFSC